MDAMNKHGMTSMSTKELRYIQVCIKIENGVVGKRCGADQPSSKVEVSEHLDGSVHIYYKDMKIKEVTKCDIFIVALSAVQKLDL